MLDFPPEPSYPEPVSRGVYTPIHSLSKQTYNIWIEIVMKLLDRFHEAADVFLTFLHTHTHSNEHVRSRRTEGPILFSYPNFLYFT